MNHRDEPNAQAPGSLSETAIPAHTNAVVSHGPDGLTGTGTAFLASDWTKLHQGDTVWIRRKGRVISTGRVDTVTPDGSVLWVTPGGASTRRMQHRADGDEMWSLRQTADTVPTISVRQLVLHAANQPH